MLTLNDGRSELWQWDTGRTLSVDADCSQVHFSNKVFGRSIDVDVVDGVAIIPDVLLQTDKDLNVWAFVGTAENGYTKISKTFRVNRRNKPADYVFTPVEQTTIAEIYAIAQSVRDDADAGLFDGNPGENGRDGVDGKDGAPGKNGTSATHSWNGTVLTITSASGTSSSDLKGDKGDKGNTGPAGKDGTPGADGKTPEYGVDYGTPEQIADIAQHAAGILQPDVNQIKDDLSKLSESKMPIVFSEIANIEITESGVSLISLQSGDHYIQEKYTTFFLKMIAPANSDATADMVPMLYFSVNNKINYDDYGYYNIFGCSNGAFSIQREYKVSSMIQFVIVGNSVSSVAMKNGYNATAYGFTTISSVGGNLNGRGRADITGVILKIRNNREDPSFPIGTKISLYAR